MVAGLTTVPYPRPGLSLSVPEPRKTLSFLGFAFAPRRTPVLQLISPSVADLSLKQIYPLMHRKKNADIQKMSSIGGDRLREARETNTNGQIGGKGEVALVYTKGKSGKASKEVVRRRDPKLGGSIALELLVSVV